MATNVEEIVLRMGMEAKAVEQGLLKVRAKNEMEAAKTKAIWAEADRAREAEYQKAVEKMIAQEQRFKMAKISIGNQIAQAERERAKKQEALNLEVAEKNLAEIKKVELAEKESLARREAAMERFAANNTPERIAIRARRQAAVNAEIAAGSGGLGWRKDELAISQMSGSSAASGAANAAYMAASGMSVSDIGKFAGASVAGAAAYKGVEAFAGTGFFQMNKMAVMQLVHSLRATIDMLIAGFNPFKAIALEAPQVAQAFTLMGKSIIPKTMRSLSFLGRAAGVLGMALDAYEVGRLAYEINRTNKAFGEYQSSEYAGQSAAVGISARLQTMIDDLLEKGAITPEQAKALSAKNQGTYAANIATQRALRKIKTSYDLEHKDDAKRMEDADKSIAKSSAELDAMKMKERDISQINKDIAERTKDIDFLKKNIAALDDKSLEAHEAKSRLLELQVQQEKDIAAQKKNQEESEKKTAEWKKWSESAARNYMRGKISASQDEAQYVSIEDLAGRDWYAAFSAQYGKGGAYDLGSGEGPFGDAARWYERNKFYQMRDRQLGNMRQADIDRQNMISARDFLIKNGAASPEMIMSKIGEDTGALRQFFNELRRNGVLQVGLNDA